MASILGIKGATALIDRVIAGDPDASEEATAIYLLRSWAPEADFEIEPDVKVGQRDRKPDFRVQKDPGPWIYVEVTKLHSSNASIRVQELLARVTERMMAIERPFLLEIILNREPTCEEEETILNDAIKACEASDRHETRVADVASILVKSGDPRVVVPSLTPEDNRPRMAISKAIIGPDRPNRQLIARVPFADERAEEILRREARQLPPRACGLLMVNVSSQPTAFESWSQRIPERLTPEQHTRVAGVILFMHATTPAEHGLVWVPYLKLIPNANAAVPIPSWVTEAVRGAREKTHRLTGHPD